MVQLQSKRKEIEAMVLREAVSRVSAGVNLIRTNTLKRLSGTRSGRTYRVPGTKVFYTASAPGESPAQRTGRLRQSIEVDVGMQGASIAGTVGTREEDYPLVLEFGGQKVAARPFLRPAYDESKSEVEQILSKRWFNGS